MIQHKDQRVGVFVDVQNMYYSAKNIYGHKVNFQEILKEAVSGRKLIRAFAYVIQTQITDDEKNFFSALYKQGFELRMKDLQVFVGGQKKGDWDVGMAIDAIRMAAKLDVVVMVTGDGDMVPAVQYLQSLGIQVEVMAFGQSTSSKLIDACDDFTDMSKEEKKYLLGAPSNIGKIARPLRAVGRPLGIGRGHRDENGNNGNHRTSSNDS